MSSSPNDLTALTPGHFLIGEPLTSNVDCTAAPNNSSPLARWNLVSHLKDEFWRRWSRDYLNQLQHRYKWKERCQNIETGMMVVIKEDNIPSLRWPLGRITNIVTGKDGLVRVADVQTANGVFRRAIHRLAQLPISTSSEDVDEPDGPTPKKKLKTSLTTTMLALMCVLLLPIVACTLPKIQPFQSQPGIYFENMGTAALTTSRWDIIVYYDMDPYWNEYSSISAYSSKLADICRLLPGKNETCRATIQQFDRLREDIKKDNDLLSATTTIKRERRGALNIVGNIGNALFGVLDNEYANHMSDTIQSIQQEKESQEENRSDR